MHNDGLMKIVCKTVGFASAEVPETRARPRVITKRITLTLNTNYETNYLRVS